MRVLRRVEVAVGFALEPPTQVRSSACAAPLMIKAAAAATAAPMRPARRRGAPVAALGAAAKVRVFIMAPSMRSLRCVWTASAVCVLAASA